MAYSFGGKIQEHIFFYYTNFSSSLFIKYQNNRDWNHEQGEQIQWNHNTTYENIFVLKVLLSNDNYKNTRLFLMITYQFWSTSYTILGITFFGIAPVDVDAAPLDVDPLDVDLIDVDADPLGVWTMMPKRSRYAGDCQRLDTVETPVDVDPVDVDAG